MENSGLIDIVRKTIEKHDMISPGDRVIIGVSGGPDSLCLLHILNQLKKELDIELFIAHINHCLRGVEADLDEEFVIQYAGQLNLDAYSKRVNVKEYAKTHKMTLEEAGREIRYSFFEDVSKQVRANKIVVAHNLNDHIETFLFNLIRGSGMEGLKGIEPIRGNIIRPLIESDRNNIELYCQENQLTPRIDASNSETIYTRNQIRLGLIPYLKEKFNVNIVKSLNRTSQLIYDENSFLCSIAEKYYTECLLEEGKDVIKLSIKRFNQLHVAVKRRIIRLIIEKLKDELRAVEKIHIDNVLEILLREKTGTRIYVPSGIVIKIEYGKIVIAKVSAEKEVIFSYAILLHGEVEIPELRSKLTAQVLKIEEAEAVKKSNNICILDYEKLLNEAGSLCNSHSTHNSELIAPAIDFLVVRNRRDGDIIRPSGTGGTKKLKEYFIDKKTPREERLSSPLIARGKEIVWIIGKRYTENYKVTNTTKEVLVLEYTTCE